MPTDEHSKHSADQKTIARQAPPYLLSAVIGGALVAQWFVAFWAPMMRKEVELQKLDNQIMERQARLSQFTVDSALAVADSALAVADSAFAVADSLRWEVVGAGALVELNPATDSVTARWQDNDFLFALARARLETYVDGVPTFELPQNFVLAMREFTDSSDIELQELRITYAKTVMLILQDDVDEEAAIAIWLAGVDLYNQSLSLWEDARASVSEHADEMEAVYAMLSQAVMRLDIEARIGDQVLQWLGIHLHNIISSQCVYRGC